MRRSLLSLLTIGLIGTLALRMTTAFFSDTETSANNLLQAGAIDMKIDNTSYYRGAFNPATSWTPDDLANHHFFDFDDLKPSDWGEDTISLHVDTNDAWACYSVTLTADDDGTCTSPELVDDPTCVVNNPDQFDGELGSLVNFAFWLDDGDNVFENDEQVFADGPASAVLPSLQGALADSSGGLLGLGGQPMDTNETYYIGKAWCFGTMTEQPITQDDDGFQGAEGFNGPDVRGSGFTCDGDQINNAAQTDRLTADISFSAVQARNNSGYICEGGQPSPTPTPSPSPSPSPSPTPSCVTTWADGFSANNQGTNKNGTAVLANRSNPSAAFGPAESLGLPYDNPVITGSFFSLGFKLDPAGPPHGSIVLSFSQPFYNQAGPDLRIYEITGGNNYPDEKVQVEASQDNSAWTLLTSSLTRDGDVDLGALSWAKYVRLTDVSNISQFESTADAYDLDAVKAYCGTQ